MAPACASPGNSCPTPRNSPKLEPSPSKLGEELARARELVLRHGWNATSYQILNPGLSLWFSRGQAAVAGYCDWGPVRVVAGAPICSPENLVQTAGELERDAAEAGLRVCYFGAGTRLESRLGSRPGFTRVLIGSQPVWDPAAWPAILSRQPSLRAQLNRARHKGVAVREADARDASQHAGLRRCLREWLAGRPMPSMHFLVEPETLGRLWDRRIFVAERNGEPVGFLVASPVAGRQGWLIEQIIRGCRAPNGTAELLLDAAFRAAAAGGRKYFTLGLVPLTEGRFPGRGENPWWLDGVFRWVRAHGGRFYNFQGLDRFKSKFLPMEWEPIYVICNHRRFTPRDLLAIVAVFGGQSPHRFLGKVLAQAFRQEWAWLGQKTLGLTRLR